MGWEKTNCSYQNFATYLYNTWDAYPFQWCKFARKSKFHMSQEWIQWQKRKGCTNLWALLLTSITIYVFHIFFLNFHCTWYINSVIRNCLRACYALRCTLHFKAPFRQRIVRVLPWHYHEYSTKVPPIVSVKVTSAEESSLAYWFS